MNIDTLKNQFIDNMNFLLSLSNKEHIFYKKRQEIQLYEKDAKEARKIEAKFWQPTNLLDKELTIKEILELEPEIVYIDRYKDRKSAREWYLSRIFCSNGDFEFNVGRFLRFIIRDKKSGKYLGIASLGSDVLKIKSRDTFIGWNEKIKAAKIRHTAIANTVIPYQPFGYNFLGGKLIAVLLQTDYIRQLWKSKYNDTLVGMTTTSVFGRHSMYQRIPGWKELDETQGRMIMIADDEYFDALHEHIKAEFPDEYQSRLWKNGKPVTSQRQKILFMIMKFCGLPRNSYENGYKRGVFFSSFFKNTKEFLRNECAEAELIPLDINHDNVVDWWKNKAIKRYTTLLATGKLKHDSLFYDDLAVLTWPETKEKYCAIHLE